MTPKSSFEQDGTIRIPTGIIRTSKPASLNLTKSNGKTAPAAVAEDVAVEVVKRAVAQEPSKKLSLVQQTQQKPDNLTSSAPSQIAPTHVASDTATATDIKHANPIEVAYRLSISEQRPGINDNGTIASAEDDLTVSKGHEPEMQRIKNLVKRKPVGGSTSSASSSVLTKENSRPQRSTSPIKANINNTLPQTSKANSSNKHAHSDSHQTHARQSSHGYNAALSPVSSQSLEEFPSLESQNPSDTTILPPGAETVRPSTPPVLRSPTPLSQLEESPSKYGLKKKSEANLKSVAEERQSQIFGQIANGVLRFLVSQMISLPLKH
jgi:hypothetical protein